MQFDNFSLCGIRPFSSRANSTPHFSVAITRKTASPSPRIHLQEHPPCFLNLYGRTVKLLHHLPLQQVDPVSPERICFQ